jgi:MoaA/NifB/PqqE/SkfB family radical SAM enzyme
MSISVTEACRVDCFLCGHYGRKKSPEMTTDEIKSLVKTATSMGCFNITWTGGDPVLRKDLAELTRFTREHGAINTMFTPATTLADRAHELAEAGLYSVYVILQSPDDKKHDELVGDKGAKKRAKAAIKACLDEGIYTGVGTYMDAGRLRDGTVESLIDYAEELGCQEILLSDPIPTGRILRREDMVLTQDDRDILVGLQKHHNLERKDGIKVFTNSCVKGPEGVGCIAGRKWVHVTAVGEVCPCDYSPFSFGNVRDEPFKKIWRRMVKHPVYRKSTDLCRMQDPVFRRRFVDAIPEGATLPYPIDGL